MGLFKKLFGGKEKPYVDENGIYFYARCQHCGTIVRVRADRRNDFSREEDGYVWHKTIVDNKCFRRMQAVVNLNRKFEVSGAELSGGEFVTEAEYNAWLTPPPNQPDDAPETAA